MDLMYTNSYLNNYFYFKNFKLKHTNSTMKIGTDSMILGAYTSHNNVKTILDIGTGCGILSFMMAQKYRNAKIVGIDIDINSINEANENLNNLDNFEYNNINFLNISLQEFVIQSVKRKEKFDLIISNPPFFTNSFKSHKSNRNLSRHNDNLCFFDLVICVKKLLNYDSIFSVILPLYEAIKFIDIAENENLYCKHLLKIQSNFNLKAKRYIMYFSLNKCNSISIDTLIFRDEYNNYTQQYKELTKEYHLFQRL